MFLAVPGMVPATIADRGERSASRWWRARPPRSIAWSSRSIDALMARTRWRPAAARRADAAQTLAVRRRASAASGCGCCMHCVNPLTMWLTLATFVGYAVVYTVLLKPLTPQNIVIGGASGAMPPVLGWAAVTGDGRRRGAAAVPDHLRLDAAALLGARALSHRGLRQGRRADAAGDARRAASRGCRCCSTR